MNKKQIMILITLLHAHIFAGVHLLSFWDKFDPRTQQLSANQIFELNYLQEKLEENREQLTQDWTKDEDIRIIIERTELAIDQSPPATQNLMKQRVINIFRQLDTNIILTDDNSIQLVSFDHPEQVALLPEQYDQQKTSEHTVKKKKRPRKTTTGTVQPLQKIKGANRTRKRLEREWKERREQARRAEMIERAKKSALETQRNIDKLNMIDQAELLKKDLQEQLAQHQISKESEKTENSQQAAQEGM